MVLLVGVVIIVIVTSAGLLAVLRSHQVANNHATATATTPASPTGQANSTATTQGNATATFIAQNSNPYPPNTGTLALFDPLNDNSRGNNWGEGTDNTGGCQFIGGAYHASASQGVEICTAHNSAVINFSFEVQMTIIQGNCGGIVFREDFAAASAYFLRICSDGYYKLINVVNPTTSHDVTPSRLNPAIHTGLNQTYLIAIVANGSNFTLYVNHQQIDTITDSSYTSGLIGLAAAEKHSLTEVVYSNARMWKL